MKGMELQLQTKMDTESSNKKNETFRRRELADTKSKEFKAKFLETEDEPKEQRAANLRKRKSDDHQESSSKKIKDNSEELTEKKSPPKKTSTPEINSEINSTEIEVKASNERKRGRAELREELSKKQKIAADLEREVIELRDKKKKLDLETFGVKTNTEEKSKPPETTLLTCNKPSPIFYQLI